VAEFTEQHTFVGAAVQWIEIPHPVLQANYQILITRTIVTFACLADPVLKGKARDIRTWRYPGPMWWWDPG